MSIGGLVALVVGIALSCAVFVHDVRRFRIGAVWPQAAPKRVAPEVHALAVLLTALGCGLIWGREMALLGALIHAALAWGAAPHILDALARILPRIGEP